MPRQTCVEGFFTDAVLRHLAPCGAWDLKGCVVRVVSMSCFFRALCGMDGGIRRYVRLPTILF